MTNNDKYVQNDDEKYHPKAAEGNVAISASLMALAFSANAYWLANNLTAPTVKIAEVDIWKY